MLNKLVVTHQDITVELVPWLDGFTPIFEGDEIIITGGTTPVVIAAPKRYGFEVTVNDGRQTIYNNLLKIYKNLYNTDILTPVTVLDYITPEESDVIVREMVILEVKQVGSSLRVHGANYTKGTTVKFVEVGRNH